MHSAFISKQFDLYARKRHNDMIHKLVHQFHSSSYAQQGTDLKSGRFLYLNLD